MPLSSDQIAELLDYADRFVGAFVKRNSPNSRYTVSGNTCDSIDHAVELAMERCSRPAIPPELAEEQDSALRDMLAEAIKNLG